MDVLLVSDPKSDKSSAALAVNVGHFDDPIEHQGLAHLLEHMMFLGTEKFPEPSEYHGFIKGHGGHHNAWTGSEHTNYYFAINNQYFAQALERFSDFFINPLLQGQWIDKEIAVVDSEYQLKYKDENRRFLSVLKVLADPAHPFAKFSVGNKTTLDMDSQEQLQDLLQSFYREKYCASKMKLVLLSNQSLDQIEAMAQQHFCAVIYRKLTTQYNDVPLYQASMKGINIAIKPERDIKKLHLNFLMPDELINYHNKPLAYIGYLLGHEGIGSLLSVLKQLGLANALSAGTGLHGYNYSEFSISIALTQVGLEQKDRVIALVFKQLALIKSQGIEAWRYLEKHSIVKTAFEYQESSNPSSFTSHLVTNLFRYAPEDVIYGDYSLDNYEPQVIDACLAQMSASNLRLITISLDQQTDKQTPWYDTPYSISPISAAQQQRWLTMISNEEQPSLCLPAANPFVVERLAYRPSDQAQRVPKILIKEDGFRLWHLPESQFKVPKGHIYTAIDSADVGKTPRSIALCRLYVEMLHDSLAELTYPAELAGMYYDIYPHQSGLTMHVSGYTPKLFLYFDMLISTIRQRKYPMHRFEEIKQQLITSWENNDKAKPINRLFKGLSSSVQPSQFGSHALKAEMLTIEIKDLVSFTSTLFNQLHLESYVHGDWQASEVKVFGQSIYRQISALATPTEQTSKQLVALKDQGSLLREISSIHDDSGLIIYYQSNHKDLIYTALFSLFNQLISPQFFAQIRTSQQLGYLCGTNYMPVNRHPGMILYIQSPVAGPKHLLNAIDQLLLEFRADVEQIDTTQWQQAIDALLNQINSPDKTQQAAAQRFWIGIGNKDHDFTHRESLIALLKQLDKQRMLAFIDEVFLDESADRLILSSLGGAFTTDENIQTGKAIDDLVEFKAKSARIEL